MRTKRSSLRTRAMTDRRQLVLPSKCCTYVDSITSPVDENNHHARRSPRQISTGGKDGRYVFFLHDFSINVLDTMNGRCIELQSSTAKIFNFVPTDDLAFGYCIFSRGQLLHLSSAAYVGLVRLDFEHATIELLQESDVLLNGIVDDDFSHSLNLLPDGRVLTVVGADTFDFDAPDFDNLDRLMLRVHNPADLKHVLVEEGKPLYHGVFESGHFFDGSFFYFRAADPNAPLDAVVTKLQQVVRNDLEGGDEVLKTRPPIAPDPHFTSRSVAGKTTWSYSGCWHRNLFYACLSAEGHEGYVNLFQVFDLHTLEWRRMTIDGLTFTQQRPFFHTDSSGDFLLVHLPHGDRPADPIDCHRIPLRQPESLLKLAMFALNRSGHGGLLERMASPPFPSIVPAHPHKPSLVVRLCRSFADHWQGDFVPLYKGPFQRLFTRFTRLL